MKTLIVFIVLVSSLVGSFGDTLHFDSHDTAEAAQSAQASLTEASTTLDGSASAPFHHCAGSCHVHSDCFHHYVKVSSLSLGISFQGAAYALLGDSFYKSPFSTSLKRPPIA